MRFLTGTLFCFAGSALLFLASFSLGSSHPSVLAVSPGAGLLLALIPLGFSHPSMPSRGRGPRQFLIR